jgi:hypothetical protein
MVCDECPQVEWLRNRIGRGVIASSVAKSKSPWEKEGCKYFATVVDLVSLVDQSIIIDESSITIRDC